MSLHKLLTESLPKLEPLISDLKELRIGDFLKSIEFKRYCISIGIEETWRNKLRMVETNRLYFSTGLDHESVDSIEVLVSILNQLYRVNELTFFDFVYEFLTKYTEWAKEDIDIKEITIDLNLLSAPSDIIEKIKKLENFYSSPVPKSEIPDSVWSAEKLETVLNKMDLSIDKKEYNLTLTYAYSCLEGLFKSFIKSKIPEKSDVDKINQLAIIVRDYLKDNIRKEKIEYPDQMLNLIPTITNAISNARNSFSDSHFDGESEQWLAEFARDCVNSIGRLIIKFIK
ncbi:MAG: hypothetical protein JNK09_11260 [Prolixibacteraceae bacterium]|nr:hypothetical protein [Prolixibacteraceae bacterium]